RSIGDCVTVLDALQKPSSGGVSRLASAPSLPSVSPSKSSQGAGSGPART
ncbi:hypothetical protein TGARI_369670, partial [Toxoplasma gondii ARI]